MTNFRELCNELLDELRYQTDSSIAEELKERASAALAEPEPASLEQGVQQMQPFVVRHYIEDERPTIKGNGFDGLEIGEDREEAEAFVAWINEKLARLGQQSIPLLFTMSCPPTSDGPFHEAQTEDGKVFLSNNDDPCYEECFESREQMQDFIDYLTRIADEAWPS